MGYFVGVVIVIILMLRLFSTVGNNQEGRHDVRKRGKK